MQSKKGYEIITDHRNGQRLAIQLSTGEVMRAVPVEVPEGTIFYTPEQQAEYRERKRREDEKRMKEAMLAMQNNALGYYFFATTERDFDGITPTTLARLIYLCTYLRYDSGYLYLTRRTPMRERDLLEVLKLSRNTVAAFVREASAFLTVLEDGRLSVDTDAFHRGALLKGKHDCFQRVYIETVRKLYNSTPPCKHLYLGYIFLMLPYVNVEHNILCFNPEETDLENVSAITLLDFCHAINYDASHAARLRKEYAKISCVVNGRAEKFCSFVFDGGNPNNSRIFINPHVLYCGKDYAHVEILGAFCKDT